MRDRRFAEPEQPSQNEEEKKPPLAKEPEPVTGKAWNTLLSHAFSSSIDFTGHLAYPWEVGTMRAVFSNEFHLQNATALGDVTNLQALQEGSASASSVPAMSDLDLQTQPAYLSAV